MLNKAEKQTVLFISCDGFGSRYMEQLFLPVLNGAQTQETRFVILQIGPKNHQKNSMDLSRQYGIPMYCLSYHRIPAAINAFKNIILGVFICAVLVLRYKVTVLQPRSYVPGLMAILIRLIFPKVDIVFDMDGFMPEERAESGLWKKNRPPYFFFKQVEFFLLRHSARIIVKTKKAIKLLQEEYPSRFRDEKFTVIPNGRDKHVFSLAEGDVRDRERAKRGLSPTAPLFVYLGALGFKYEFEIMIKVFSRALQKNPNAKWLVLTSSLNHEIVRQAVAHFKIPAEAVLCQHSEQKDLPLYLGIADIGFALFKSTYAMKAVSPIKVGEYFLCGVPVIATPHTGDLDALPHELGDPIYFYDQNEAPAYEKLLLWVEKVMNEREFYRNKARQLGLVQFDLENMIRRYAEVYRQLKGKI